MKKILLVDDNEQDRALYRRFLGRHLGFESISFEEAATAAEARAQFLDHRPDCVLLDYNLPDADGLDILADLKSLTPPDSLCVVMVTGGGSEELAVRALNNGALDYLVKQQFDQELLAKTVLHAIEKNEWRQYVSRYHDELRAVNQQLRDSLDALTETRHEIGLKNAQLTAANTDLARANLDLDNFVYAASHDLKQPVDNLRGLFEELRNSATFHDAEAGTVLRLVDTSLQDLSKTIHDLSAVVQAERMTGGQPTEKVVLADLTNEILTLLQPQIAAAEGRVQTDFTALPALQFERISLRTILLNLLGNALKYRHPERPAQVEVRSYYDAGQPVLEVRDNGLGIDLERHGGEIFQLFRRFHPQASSGTGVGLFLVNRLVQARGGRIEVTSQEGQGTTFRLYLGPQAR
ncbi:sensor histidine kinase [Hymenobacter properus]|uniref:histidine kinase n=1 Tax=Hymenobacter properus TaxID=2791026 RepID=A0A931BI27_9BACT|nr:hybrid sensor histidine kinase/response regulator [Hymenobacter properus]MBF9143989.1 hybrid sensor histidine kinase/response regulator [Hymenobacter properus]MBR7722804.1 hybrid sensor histidine kinase/response regulator [Microvirga sp. SRT04]